jgi:hypothetical protein
VGTWNIADLLDLNPGYLLDGWHGRHEIFPERAGM